MSQSVFIYKTIKGYVVVDNKNCFPQPVGNIIQLEDNITYLIVAHIDLEGCRIIGGVNSTIVGWSSENCSITSTGLNVGEPLISSIYTLTLRHFTIIDVDAALYLDGSGTTMALDWTGVNFENILNVGVIKNFSNFIFSKGALLNSANLEFDGTGQTIGFDNSLLQGNGLSNPIINIKATANISRRFRIIYSAFIVFGSTIGINFNSSATIPFSAYILDTVSFTSGGAYLNGLDHTSNYTSFSNCNGIINSAEIASYNMLNNATITIISGVDTPTKILGTTSSGVIVRKFTITNNRATYIGSIKQLFKINANVSVTSASANDQIGFYVAKNGLVINDSEMYITTNANSRAEAVSIQGVAELQENDYIEIWVENASDNSDITVTFLNVLVTVLT